VRRVRGGVRGGRMSLWDDIWGVRLQTVLERGYEKEGECSASLGSTKGGCMMNEANGCWKSLQMCQDKIMCIDYGIRYRSVTCIKDKITTSSTPALDFLELP
jgi:hypothetical protein